MFSSANINCKRNQRIKTMSFIQGAKEIQAVNEKNNLSNPLTSSDQKNKNKIQIDLDINENSLSEIIGGDQQQVLDPNIKRVIWPDIDEELCECLEIQSRKQLKKINENPKQCEKKLPLSSTHRDSQAKLKKREGKFQYQVHHKPEQISHQLEIHKKSQITRKSKIFSKMESAIKEEEKQNLSVIECSEYETYRELLTPKPPTEGFEEKQSSLITPSRKMQSQRKLIPF